MKRLLLALTAVVLLAGATEAQARFRHRSVTKVKVVAPVQTVTVVRTVGFNHGYNAFNRVGFSSYARSFGVPAYSYSSAVRLAAPSCGYTPPPAPPAPPQPDPVPPPPPPVSAPAPVQAPYMPPAAAAPACPTYSAFSLPGAVYGHAFSLARATYGHAFARRVFVAIPVHNVVVRRVAFVAPHNAVVGHVGTVQKVKVVNRGVVKTKQVAVAAPVTKVKVKQPRKVKTVQKTKVKRRR